MLEKGYILPNIHFDRPNKRIPFDKYKIQIPTSLIPWPADQYKRTSVNSFGYGGTNAHAIVDGYDQGLLTRRVHTDGTLTNRHSADGSITNGDCEKVQASTKDATAAQRRLFLFGARDESALERIRTQYIDHFAHLDSSAVANEEYLDNLSFTLGARRSRLD